MPIPGVEAEPWGKVGLLGFMVAPLSVASTNSSLKVAELPLVSSSKSLYVNWYDAVVSSVVD